jgi:hypothetical protein
LCPYSKFEGQEALAKRSNSEKGCPRTGKTRAIYESDEDAVQDEQQAQM